MSLELLKILYEDCQFTKDFLMRKIITKEIYTQNVKNLLDMMKKKIKFYQIENEDIEDDPNGIYDPHLPNISICATYDIGANYQVLVIFDEDRQMMDIDIGFDIFGLNIYKTNLCNHDAILHALFLYAWNTFLQNENSNMCKAPGCIYFRQYGENFCCKECITSKISPRCILLRQQGIICGCKICKIVKQLT